MPSFQGHLPPVEGEGGRLAHQAAHHHPGADDVRDHRCNSHAGDAQVKDDHQHQVQDDVDNAAHHQEPEGSPAVPLAAQHGGAEVVEHDEGHSHEVDLEVRHGQLQHVGGRREHPQHGAREHEPGGRQKEAADEGDEDAGVYGLAHLLPLPLSDVVRDQHVGAHGDPHEEVDQHVDDRSVAAHRRHGLAAVEPSHHGHVRRVEQLLQDGAGRKRQREQDDLVPQGPVQHVDLIALFALSGAFRHDPDLPLQKN